MGTPLAITAASIMEDQQGKLIYANSPWEYHNFATRCQYPWPEHKTDCSGAIAGSILGAGGALPQPQMSSAAFAVWGHEAQSGTTFEIASKFPFGIAIKGPDEGRGGFGDFGHIVAFTGEFDANGTPLICEAAGHNLETTRIVPWRSEISDYFMLIPTLAYVTTPLPDPGVLMDHDQFLGRAPGSNGVYLIDGFQKRGCTQEDINTFVFAQIVSPTIFPVDPTVLLHLHDTPRMIAPGESFDVANYAIDAAYLAEHDYKPPAE